MIQCYSKAATELSVEVGSRGTSLMRSVAWISVQG